MLNLLGKKAELSLSCVYHDTKEWGWGRKSLRGQVLQCIVDM